MGTDRLGRQKMIALIAHDNRKAELIDWAENNRNILSKHFLCGTGTIAKLISEKTGLEVKVFKSGLMGGGQQIGASIINANAKLKMYQ